MLRKLQWVLFLSIVTCGCIQNPPPQSVNFHDDGRTKPLVALPPLFDRSGAEMGWSLTEEFTAHIRSNIMKNVCLNTPGEMNLIVTHLNETNNPFSSDVEWIKSAFKGYEFVVFTELVEYDIYPKPSKGDLINKIVPSSELILTMRIRIFDVRAQRAQVILQELFHQNYLIPSFSHSKNVNPDQWGRLSFLVSPLGLAHSQFIKGVSNRIEEYILLAKNR